MKIGKFTIIYTAWSDDKSVTEQNMMTVRGIDKETTFDQIEKKAIELIGANYKNYSIQSIQKTV